MKTYAGDVRLERAARAVTMVTGLGVMRGDRFTTGANGRLVILLNDQSTLDLYESSVLVLNEQVLKPGGGAQTRVTLLSGILRSIVHVTSGGAPPNFEVHTPNAIAAARGTDYDTGHHDHVQRQGFPGCQEFTDVFDRTGKVDAYNIANRSAVASLGPGQGTTIPCGGAPLPPFQAAAGLGQIAAYGTLGALGLEGAIVGGFAAAGGFDSSTASPSQ